MPAETNWRLALARTAATAGAPSSAGVAAPENEAARACTVSELTERVRRSIEDAYAVVYVRGELSNLSRAASGHLYFCLKDESAQLAGIMFRGRATALAFTPENGQEVLAHGRLSVYAARGIYQLVAEGLRLSGEGALQAAYQELKRRLAAEGLFDAERKKPLPAYPTTVGVVTSDTGAAIRDILTVLERRHAGISVVIYPVRVQGMGAAAEIAHAIAELNRIAAAEVLIVGRGGGSIEDLWAFNEESVARAIAASAIPVVSAVGHERDWTIADHVADIRAATPSAAAELVSANRVELLGRLSHLEHRATQATQSRLALARRALEERERRLERLHPLRRLQERQQLLDDLAARLLAATRRAVERKRLQLDLHYQRLLGSRPQDRLHALSFRCQSLGRALTTAGNTRITAGRQRLERLEQSLDLLSPFAVLNRGYSIARRRTDGRVLQSVADVEVAEQVEILLRDGRLLTWVFGQRRS